MNQTIEILTEKITEDIIRQPKRELEIDEPLISSGLIDSFSLVDLALMVEEIFGVHIEDYELTADTFDTIEELAVLILERQQSRH
ncbi:MAG: acyl carrier protein [Flexilinea sp.]